MTQIAYGPVNITFGNAAQFIVEFLDTYGNLTVPSGGTVTVSYTNTSAAPQTDTVALSLTNSYFLGTWGSSLAALGVATWQAFAAGSTSIAQTGTIRVITP
jgi:hypothetical protein